MTEQRLINGTTSLFIVFAVTSLCCVSLRRAVHPSDRL
jgi:hypothetical protein